ncbi:MAG TPA: class F sortase [Candidatus Paceibacterota bacterium]
MSDKPLLLSSAKSVVAVKGTLTSLRETRHAKRLRLAAIAVGLFVVLVGAANVTTRLAHAVLGPTAALDIFAPAVILDNPSALKSTRMPLTAASTTPLVPARLTITSIGVDAAVEQVGKKADGSMGTPQKFGDVAWYALGAKPGEAGNAVIDGHVNNALTTAGVFDHLSQVQVGDTITVADASGRQVSFAVTKIQTITDTSAQDSSIFNTSGPAGLVLITCQGDWVPSAKSFNERLVVFATLVT